MSTQLNDPIIEITQSILTEAAQRPWLAALLMRRKPGWLTRLAQLAQRVRNLPRHTRRVLRRKLAYGLAAAALLLALAGTPTAYAAGAMTVTANVGLSAGGCSLAKAIVNANNGNSTAWPECAGAGTGGNTITIDPPQTLSYAAALSGDGNSALPDITSQITIEGNGSTIQRSGTSDYFRILNVTVTGDLTLNQATISGGNVVNGSHGIEENGGGIRNYGTLTLENSTISNNMADNAGGIYNVTGSSQTVTGSEIISNTAASSGGGLYNNGTLTVTGSEIISNTATNDSSDPGGGGIFNNSGTLTVTGSTISHNTANTFGGGIINFGTMTVSDSTISHNASNTQRGGGIYNFGGSGNHATATVSNSTVSGNTAATSGGGIDNHGTLMVTNNSTLSGNTAASYNGGGINNSGTLTVTNNSTVSNNTATSGNGGGIENDYDGTATVSDSTISGNTSAFDGGGIYNVPGGPLTVTNSTISDNTAHAGGGILSHGDLTVANSTLSGNTATFGGGGIFSNGGPLTVQNSTISGNSANSGGGIDNYGMMTIQNSTISGNTASQGGGMENGPIGTLTVQNSTISRNTSPNGAGINNIHGGTATVQNSIVAVQTSGVDCFVGDGITSQGYNIESGTSCGFDPLVTPGDQQNVTNTALNLYTLANNGGSTKTHGLAEGSVAIDQIPAANCSLTTDQRGTGFDRPVNYTEDTEAKCDIGAFELQIGGSPPNAVTLRDLTATANTSPGVFGAILAAFATLGALLIGRRVKVKTRP